MNLTIPELETLHNVGRWLSNTSRELLEARREIARLYDSDTTRRAISDLLTEVNGVLDGAGVPSREAIPRSYNLVSPLSCRVMWLVEGFKDARGWLDDATEIRDQMQSRIDDLAAENSILLAARFGTASEETQRGIEAAVERGQRGPSFDIARFASLIEAVHLARTLLPHGSFYLPRQSEENVFQCQGCQLWIHARLEDCGSCPAHKQDCPVAKIERALADVPEAVRDVLARLQRLADIERRTA